MERETKKIELHHHSIEEIMGAPPTKSIALGSGIILIILLILLTSSVFVFVPDIIRVNAVMYGQTPLEVITSPASGQIIFLSEGSNKQFIQKGDPVLYIKSNTTEENIPVLVSAQGLFEINPFIRIRGKVFHNDTIGYIWSEKPAPVICVLQISNTIAGKIQNSQKVRIHTELNESLHFIEGEIIEKSNPISANYTQLIALISDNQLPESNIYGAVEVSVEIVTGKKNLFQQLINPFRGLQK